MTENANLLDLTDDEDFVDIINMLRNVRRRPQNYRPREDHFLSWNEEDFIKRFRLSKNGVRYIVNLISDNIRSPTQQNHALSPEQMVLLTLRFYATGNFLQTAGDLIGIDKGTASRIIWKVTQAIAGLYRQFVRMPQTEEELREVSQKFYNVARLPKCCGAIDCTHVKIISPGGNNAEIYRNRKGFFSLNVQAVCDANCMFQDVVCRWPGSTHDSQIFLNSHIRARCENNDFDDYVLVGDSGYAVKKYLITPLAEPITRAEQLFNESQIRTRNCIERKFGQWKRRFPILAFGIRLKLEKDEAVVIATAVLENIARLLNEQDPPFDEEGEVAVNFVNDVNIQPYMNIYNVNNVNAIVRHQLINDYFSQL
ncbi:hypothetical protein NQ315_014748 [Exocentrus adspersus]|uniref:Putative nuclease HARBI1 n=1 Tax=Exocentrus adspersus TaxID=1586481 RepID=A0AAV8VEM5_9CUCU|nr:hypothetical protein NQ315_014748 [Exocentrus adspersus]